jgi:hypothetical protein
MCREVRTYVVGGEGGVVEGNGGAEDQGEEAEEGEEGHESLHGVSVRGVWLGLGLLSVDINLWLRSWSPSL